MYCVCNYNYPFSVFQNLSENEAVNSLSGNMGGSRPGWRNFKTAGDK